MNNDFEKTELRSEKIRKIINEAPPWLIRYGTTVIAFLLLFVIMYLYYFNIWAQNVSVK